MKYNFANAILKQSEDINLFDKEEGLKSKLDWLDNHTSINAMTINIDICVKFDVEYTYKDRDSSRSDNVEFRHNTTINIIPKYCIYKDEAVKLIKRYIINFINTEVRRNLNVKRIKTINNISNVCCGLYDKDLMVWQSGSVSIWYVEQECGEHWVTLKTDPKYLNGETILLHKD